MPCRAGVYEAKRTTQLSSSGIARGSHTLSLECWVATSAVRRRSLGHDSRASSMWDGNMRSAVDPPCRAAASVKDASCGSHDSTHISLKLSGH